MCLIHRKEKRKFEYYERLRGMARSDGQQIRPENQRLAVDVFARANNMHLPSVRCIREGKELLSTNDGKTKNLFSIQENRTKTYGGQKAVPAAEDDYRLQLLPSSLER